MDEFHEIAAFRSLVSPQTSMYPNISANSSSFPDLLRPPPPPPPPHLSTSNSSAQPLDEPCFRSRFGVCLMCTFFISYTFFLLPINILVLYLGYQQRGKPASRSGCFTFHSVALQLNEYWAFVVLFYGSYFDLTLVMLVAASACFTASLGGALFHLLTCVEHYLAVVHPITYRGLKGARGIRIRKVLVGCVWLFSGGRLLAVYFVSLETNAIVSLLNLSLILFLISFCCISVLCSLKRRRPGDGSGGRVDQSKRRAVHTIAAVAGALLLRFGGDLIISVLDSSSALTDLCEQMMFGLWVDAPSRFVLPLLFLQRAGKLQRRKQTAESVRAG